MIWWVLAAFVAGFVFARYHAREERRYQAVQQNKLRRQLYDAREQNAELTRLLHGERGDWQ